MGARMYACVAMCTHALGHAGVWRFVDSGDTVKTSLEILRVSSWVRVRVTLLIAPDVDSTVSWLLCILTYNTRVCVYICV